MGMNHVAHTHTQRCASLLSTACSPQAVDGCGPRHTHHPLHTPDHPQQAQHLQHAKRALGSRCCAWASWGDGRPQGSGCDLVRLCHPCHPPGPLSQPCLPPASYSCCCRACCGRPPPSPPSCSCCCYPWWSRCHWPACCAQCRCHRACRAQGCRCGCAAACAPCQRPCSGWLSLHERAAARPACPCGLGDARLVRERRGRVPRWHRRCQAGWAGWRQAAGAGAAAPLAAEQRPAGALAWLCPQAPAAAAAAAASLWQLAAAGGAAAPWAGAGVVGAQTLVTRAARGEKAGAGAAVGMGWGGWEGEEVGAPAAVAGGAALGLAGPHLPGLRLEYWVGTEGLEPKARLAGRCPCPPKVLPRALQALRAGRWGGHA